MQRAKMALKDLLIVRDDQPPERPTASRPAARGMPVAARAVDEDVLFSVRRDTVIRNAQVGLLLHVLFAGLVSAVLYGTSIPSLWVSAWLMTILAALLVRAVFLGAIVNVNAEAARPREWLSIWSGTMIGIAWGLCGLSLFAGLTNGEALVVGLAMIGAMCGSATNGARLPVFLAWITPTVAPLLAFGIYSAGFEHIALIAVVLLLVVALSRAARNATNLFKRSAALVGSIQRADERLRDSARRFRIIADHSHDWESWWDRNGRLVWTSPSSERFTGYSAEEFMLNPDLALIDTIHPDDRERVAHAVRVGAKLQERGDIEFRVVHRDGSVRWCASVSNPIIDENGNVDGFRSSARDISVQKRLEADLEQLASIDSLTNIMNRRAFIEKASEEIYRAGRYDKRLVVAILDIDHFKRINDSHGHAVGDRCLVMLSDIVGKSIRQSDLFARFGGEEFVLLLPETELSHGMQLCERLRRRIEMTPVHADGASVTMSTSIGVADFQDSTASLDDLLARADAALYAAKRKGRNQVAYGSEAASMQGLSPPANVERLSRTA